MKRIAVILPVITGAALGVVSFAQSTRSASTPASASAPSSKLVERGKYLVHRASMCVDCHSPRDATGNFVKGKHLTGGPLAFAPSAPMPWNGVAPRIAGLPVGFTREDTIHFLMTGQRPQGRPSPLPPMPDFRFDRDDAESITAYLESLAQPSSP